jgi:hypothetical protein
LSKPSRRPSRQKPAFQRPQNLANYHHKQAAKTLLSLLLFPVLICALAAFNHPEYRYSLWAGSTVLTVIAMLFSSMSIEVNAQTLHWRFGPGLIHKQVELSEIASVQMTRSSWLDGVGIHYTKRGWLYNVSGRDAILITQKNGKSFLLGSDDVVSLWEALQNRIDT